MHEDILGKRLLVLGGTLLQCEIIKCAQKMGLDVVVTDYNSVEDSPGKQLVSEYYPISVTDVDKVVELIKDKKIDGVITGYSDQLLPYFAEICEKSGLPCYGTKEQFDLLIQKKDYRNLFKRFNIPVVDGFETNSIESIDFNSLCFPLLTKPSDGSGSRGVRVSETITDFVHNFNYSKSFSKSGDVIIEKCMSGQELVSFWFIQRGIVYLTALGNWHKNKYYDNTNLMGVGYSFPSVFLEKYAIDIVPKVQKMIDYVGIKEGTMFMQGFLENNILKIYDVGFRLTGTLEYKIINHFCGFDIMERMIEYSITGSSGPSVNNLVDPYFGGKYAWNASVLIRPGKIKQIIGFDKVKESYGVIDAVLNHSIDDVILDEEKGQLKQIALRVLGFSDTPEGIVQNVKNVFSCFDVIDEFGNSMVLEPRNLEDFSKYVI